SHRAPQPALPLLHPTNPPPFLLLPPTHQSRHLQSTLPPLLQQTNTPPFLPLLPTHQFRLLLSPLPLLKLSAPLLLLPTLPERLSPLLPTVTFFTVVLDALMFANLWLLLSVLFLLLLVCLLS
ncbi:hypothetical protein HDU76_010028, partial [Blyttiomyces sp. JEL0837]